MICENCHTTLPDEAIACWKCGQPVSQTPTPVSVQHGGPDIVKAILTFFISAILFACAGWSVPFMVSGNIMSLANQSPEWSSRADLIGEISFSVTAILFFVGVWWACYWLLTHALAKPNQT